MFTTNYYDTFIEIAPDCKVSKGEVPNQKGGHKTVANLQFDMIYENPYRYTSDDVLFGVFVLRREFDEVEIRKQKEIYFSKGQPCLRASPLTKSYGWGVHFDSEAKVAIYGIETKEYASFLADNSIKKYKAMRSSKK